MKRHTGTAVTLVAAVFLLAGCTTKGDDDPVGTLASELNATAAATPTATPSPVVTPAPLVALVDGLPEGAVGPLLVYAHELRSEQSGGRSWPVLEVVTFDLGLGEQTVSFNVGGIHSFPIEVRLAGHWVLADLETRLVAFELNGGLATELREAPEGGWFPGFAVSADGKLVALAETIPDPPGFPLSPATILFLDVVTGRELAAVPQDEATYGRPAARFGRAEPFVWRDDGRGVVVRGDVPKESLLHVATVLLEGAARIHDLDGAAYVAPGGRLAASGASAFGCSFSGGARLEIVDLDNGAILLRIEEEGRAFRPWEWSPDGSELFYEVRTLPTDTNCHELDELEAESEFFVLTIDGGNVEPVADRLAVRERWYGDRSVTFVCEGVEVPGWFRSHTHRLRTPDACAHGNGAAALLVDGVEIGSGESIEVLGFIEVPR